MELFYLYFYLYSIRPESSCSKHTSEYSDRIVRNPKFSRQFEEDSSLLWVSQSADWRVSKNASEYLATPICSIFHQCTDTTFPQELSVSILSVVPEKWSVLKMMAAGFS